MKTSILATLKRYLQLAHHQFLETPERSLDRAYQATLQIKALEDQYFQGQPINIDSTHYSGTAIGYFQSELQSYLNTARVRLAEFKTSQSVMRLTPQGRLSTQRNAALVSTTTSDQTVLVLEKLKVIDDVLSRYQLNASSASAIVPITNSAGASVNVVFQNGNGQGAIAPLNLVSNLETISDKTGVLPRSILGTLNRIQIQLDPKAEEKVVNNFRSNRAKTTVALRFILLLLLIPLLTQQLSRALVVGPIVDRVRKNTAEVFLNLDLQEEALAELQQFEEKLRFQALVKLAPTLSQEETEKQLQEKAQDIAVKYRGEGAGAIKNVFADILATIAFTLVVLTNRRGVAALKAFMDEIAYGLSDSAKAFIIILFTDTFVGFHSPHGWEVLLDNLARHLGLPPSHDFIYLFIATVPVIMDTIFKYWIFRYLNGLSPSAVATYKEMNE